MPCSHETHTFRCGILGAYHDGKVYSIDTSGNIRWKFQTGNKIVSSPFASNGAVFVGSSDNNLYALDSESGEMLWRFLTDGEIISSPIVHNGIVYFGSWSPAYKSSDVYRFKRDKY